jgi:transposase
MVVGVDPHVRSHTAVAVEERSGQAVGTVTVAAGRGAGSGLVAWAAGCAAGGEVVFAVEDCRHVSGPLERELAAVGQRVVRVPPGRAVGARQQGRRRGKSDVIDAEAVARAYLRHPAACPPRPVVEPWRELKLLVDRREQLVAERRREQCRLRWLLHDLGLGADVPVRGLERGCWQRRLARRLGRQPPTVQVRLGRELVGRIVALTRTIDALERDITPRAAAQGAALLTLPGCGPLTAAKLLGELGDRSRYQSDAHLAAAAGTAPLEASSGAHQRHRLNRGGNRQLNCAIHRIAITQARSYPPAQAYLARRQREGKTTREALRCLKRHLTRRIYHLTT